MHLIPAQPWRRAESDRKATGNSAGVSSIIERDLERL